MNQGRIWCVVHPTVGLPLLLGSVALTSLAVHASVMSHTTWMSNYWQGRTKVSTSENAVQPTGKLAALTSTAPTGEPGFSISVTPVAAQPGNAGTAFVVTVAPASGAGKALPLVTAASQ